MDKIPVAILGATSAASISILNPELLATKGFI